MSRPYAEVIGDPIAHSRSPIIHNHWLKALGIDADYRATHITPDALPDYIAARRDDPLWCGCNVTIPHKIAVMDHVADPGAIRDGIGAMNIVARDESGGLFGTNSDAGGFYLPIADLPLAGESAIVLGSGGAARAVLFALAQCDIGDVTIMARSPLKAAALLARFGLKGSVKPLTAALPLARLLVNTTPMGMVGQDALTIKLDSVGKDCLVYDLVYAPLETPLLKMAAAAGLETVSGIDMLIGQAQIAFELFFAVPPPADDEGQLQALLLS
ncbi:MAG: shikimate dehydrogenase family protein [Sphingomonadaceae bacterium]